MLDDDDTQGVHTMVGAVQFASEVQREVMSGFEPKAGSKSAPQAIGQSRLGHRALRGLLFNR